ncbi:MAG: hypothetical protein M1831_003038 [Alyxoria varia]|nr:MAG: hypothetical protein M1831_003038 [Alyxoria varia]
MPKADQKQTIKRGKQGRYHPYAKPKRDARNKEIMNESDPTSHDNNEGAANAAQVGLEDVRLQIQAEGLDRAGDDRHYDEARVRQLANPNSYA